MRQFSIYALSINQIVFTSSRRTSWQWDGEPMRVEGGRHTQFWRRVQSEIARLYAAMLWWVYWKIAWHLGGFRADLSGIRSKHSRFPTDLGHVWQLWENEIQFNQSCGKQQHRLKRQQIIALGGGRERQSGARQFADLSHVSKILVTLTGG